MKDVKISQISDKITPTNSLEIILPSNRNRSQNAAIQLISTFIQDATIESILTAVIQ